MDSQIEQFLREDLEDRVKEALQEHPVEDVIAYLEQELWQLETMSLYATKDGFGGAPDYDQLQFLIKITKDTIEKLRKGEIKVKRLVQMGLDGFIQITSKKSLSLKV
ncbi:MAG: hypothetical protein ACTSV7_13495 [Candidatus Baldrarchaeia archaeon]